MFKGKRKSKKKTNSSKNTFIAKEIEVEGNLKGEGAIQIEGTLHGDIHIPSVVIGEYGKVYGNITATNVIINGILEGSINCTSLEIMPNGYVTKQIKTQKLLIAGTVNSTIEAQEEIKIYPTANITAPMMKSQIIVVNGLFQGKIIALELLIIGQEGSITGEITVKNIKTYEGGKLRGSIHNYEEEKALFSPLEEPVELNALD